MALSHLLGFDLCPQLRERRQRHLFVPRGTKIPDEIAAVCEASVDTALEGINLRGVFRFPVEPYAGQLSCCRHLRATIRRNPRRRW